MIKIPFKCSNNFVNYSWHEELKFYTVYVSSIYIYMYTYICNTRTQNVHYLFFLLHTYASFPYYVELACTCSTFELTIRSEKVNKFNKSHRRQR